MAIWLTQGDLENRMTIATVAAIFDDSNETTLNEIAIAQVINGAEAQVLSWLGDEYGPLPFSDTVLAQLATDPLLKDAAVQYAMIYSYDRDPAYVRQNGKERADKWTQVTELMERILDARQRATTVVTPPANVGGVVVDNGPRIFVDGPNGECHNGDY